MKTFSLYFIPISLIQHLNQYILLISTFKSSTVSLSEMFCFIFTNWNNLILKLQGRLVFFQSLSRTLVVQLFGHVWLWPHELQHTRVPCPSLYPWLCSNSHPLSWWCHPTISSSVTPSPPAFSLFQHQGLFQWVSSSHQVAKGLEFQLQHQSFQWTPRTDLL